MQAARVDRRPDAMNERPHPPGSSAGDNEPAVDRVQAFGFVLTASEQSWWIVRASVNAAVALGVPLDDLLDRPLDAVCRPEAVHDLRSALQIDAHARVFGLRLTAEGPLWDVSLRRGDGEVVIECEPAEAETTDAAARVLAMMARLRAHDGERAFHRAAARELRALTGFDRVMVCRFGEDGSGEVIAESLRTGLPALLGMRYPASDIPPPTRARYLRQGLRITADVGAETFAVAAAPCAGQPPFGLSLGTLCAAAPAQLDALRTMGVVASMSVALVRQNALWGLLVCHHPAPLPIGLARRTAVELFGQMVSLLLENREREAEAAFEARGQRLQQQLVTAMAGEGSGLDGLVARLDGIADLLSSDGIALTLDGHTALRGLTPTAPQFAGLVNFLRGRPIATVHARHEIGAEYPPGREFADRAAGMLVLPLSRPPRDFLVFFRKEVARTVWWAGDPAKPTAAPGARDSFDKWRETVRFQSLPWHPVECRTAEALRVSLLDLIIRLNDLSVAERRRADQRQELLIAELNHRLRNILGLIRGVISQSKDIDQSVEDFAGVIGGRIQALARAHDQITADRWGPALFTALVAAEAGAYRDGDGDRVVVRGTDALISPEAFTTIALVLHEMMTNSAKYGALGARGGRVDVATDFDPLGRFVIAWREAGGPPVQPPRRKGFGSTVIERSIGHDLQGDARLDYDPAGLRAEFVIPAAYVRAAGARARPVGAPGAAQEAMTAVPGDVLIVEDNMIIALDAEDMVRKLGVPSVRIASNAGAALDLIAERRPDFALLDVNLGNETSFDIAARLVALGVPFAFASGYGEQVAFPDGVAAMPRLRKPYAAEALRAVIQGVMG